MPSPHVNRKPDEGRARDLGVVAGVATAMLALKILKLLPGIPFAPGHKTVLLIPLYVVAGCAHSVGAGVRRSPGRRWERSPS